MKPRFCKLKSTVDRENIKNLPTWLVWKPYNATQLWIPPSGSLCSKRRSITYRERATSSPSLLVWILSFFLPWFYDFSPLPCKHLVSFPRHLMLVIFFIFSLLSFVLLCVSCNCYCWFSPISHTVWYLTLNRSPSDIFTWWRKQNQFPKGCVVISKSDFVCVSLCVCVYFILVISPHLLVVVCE
jgi:hypothetical protein